MAELEKHWIEANIEYYKRIQNNYGFKPGDYPVAEKFYEKEVSLPIYPDLSTEDVSLVVNNILEIIFV